MSDEHSRVKDPLPTRPPRPHPQAAVLAGMTFPRGLRQRGFPLHFPIPA